MTHRRARTLVLLITALLTVVIAPSAQADPPAPPTLIAPAHDSTATIMDVPLSVRVTDPDGAQVDVRFEGRKKGGTVPGGGTGGPFTLVALPDTQNYTYSNRQGTIAAQAQWVVNTRSALNTAMVVHLGDLVSNYDNLTQWGHISSGLRIIDSAGVPNTVVGGNHDFDVATGEHAQYDTYFPPSRYAGAAWTPSSASYGGYLGQNLYGPDPVDTKNMNNFALFSAGGRDFLVLNLEWEAPQYALDWGARVLAAHPDRIAIVVTHSFLHLSGNRPTIAQRPGGVPPETMWNTFVSQNCSIKLVLNGHVHNGDLGEANRSDLNRCGEPVQQILTDYQSRANGGDGWLRYYTFNPTANTMTAATYSPTLNRYETDADSAFTLPFALSTVEPAPFTSIGEAQAVASGGVAHTTWTGLNPDTEYEWRAIASDGTSAITSPTWTVRTPADSDLVDDAFTRNVTNGWGSIDGDHDWQLASSLSSFAVDGAAGTVATPAGGGRLASLTGLSASNVRVTADLSWPQAATGSGTYASVLARAAGFSGYLGKVRLGVDRRITLGLSRIVNSAETQLTSVAVPGLTVAPGDIVRVRLEAEDRSPTRLRAKVWPISAPEPSGWSVTATDSTPVLQGPGSAGLRTYTSSTASSPATVRVDRFTVSRLGVAPPANVPPTAVISAPAISQLTVSLSGSESSDSDGSVASYRWDFGDGANTTGATVSHTYATDGTYIVTLTVTDDDGATASTTRQVTVTADPPNQSPASVIATPSIVDRTVTLSSAGSSDPDGTITAYSWDFGDSTTGMGTSTTHAYAADGTYTVRLTVTDDDGATDEVTRDVTVTGPPATTDLARDGFARTSSSGWGSAELGGAWSHSGSATRFTVSGGTGLQKLTARGTTADAILTGVSSTATDLRARLSWDRTGASGTLYASVLPRRISSATDYRCKVFSGSSGSIQLSLVRRIAGAETTMATAMVPGLKQTAGQVYNTACRSVTSGPGSQLAGKLWAAGAAEPMSWLVTAADATAALQGPGGVGVSSYLSSGASTGVTLAVDDVIATTP